jgi:hypothetical protein
MACVTIPNPPGLFLYANLTEHWGSVQSSGSLSSAYKAGVEVTASAELQTRSQESSPGPVITPFETQVLDLKMTFD